EDVTEEYSDSQVQLRNFEAEETQFLKILETAKTIQETLDVTREISRVRGNIDRLKGRMQYLEKNVAMATITINLATDEASLPVIEQQNQWRPLVVVKNALRGVLATFKALSYLIIWVVIFGAIWLPLIVIVYFGRRWWKARKQNPFGR
ncbi:MAG: DUF4349 domain-containing protein, partial [bacterium]|nr:DUF4349 domain-containing protein [bacterium]